MLKRQSLTLFRQTSLSKMKYADLQFVSRGEFPHGLNHPTFIKKSDKNIPWYFATMRSVYHWPVLGDNWDDQGRGVNNSGAFGGSLGHEHDLHMFYTLAWWKLGEGITEDDKS